MSSRQRLLVPLWAGLLLLGSPVLSGAAPGNSGEFFVAYEGGLVSLRADDVPLDFVVQEIAARAELRFVQHVALDRRISVAFESVPLPEVLAELLQEESYQLYASADARGGRADREPIPGALWIFARGSAFAPAALAYLEIALLEGGSAEKREAIRELRRLGTPEAVQVLSLALGDLDAGIRGLAMAALTQLGGDDALAALASVTADDNPLARGRAAEAIAMAGGNSAHAYLDLALHDADPRVRAAAIDSFVELNDERTRAMIRDALHDPDPKVRERAVDVLENLEDEAMFDALFPVE